MHIRTVYGRHLSHNNIDQPVFCSDRWNARTITMMTLCEQLWGCWISADIYYCLYDIQSLKSLFMTNLISLTDFMPRFWMSSMASICFSQLSSCLQVETTPIMYKVKSAIKTAQPTTGPSFCYKIFDKLQSPSGLNHKGCPCKNDLWLFPFFHVLHSFSTNDRIPLLDGHSSRPHCCMDSNSSWGPCKSLLRVRCGFVWFLASLNVPRRCASQWLNPFSLVIWTLSPSFTLWAKCVLPFNSSCVWKESRMKNAHKMDITL